MKKGPLCVLACYVIWGLLPGYWKLMSSLDSFYILATRILWSLIFVGLILLASKRMDRVRAAFCDRRELLRLSLAGVLICINWGAFIWAVNSGHILDSSLAYYMNPILTILIGTFVFHEKLTRLQWVAVGITLMGIVAAVVRFGQIPWLALVIGGAFALYGAVKKGCRVDAGTSLFLETLVLSPASLAFVLWSEWNGTGAVGNVGPGGFALLASTGIATSVPLLFYAKGIVLTPYTTAGILMYVNPTLQFIVGALFFHEQFTTTYAILFGFVWTGLIFYVASDLLAHRAQRKNQQLEEQ